MNHKKSYQTPGQESLTLHVRQYICGDDSLPYGGENGPDVAETKSHDEDEHTDWGDLW